MATDAQVAALRPLIADTENPYEFDRADLSAQIDATDGDLRRAAGVVWGIKASRLAGLVNVTEGSSTRQLGNLYKQALEMASFYGGAEVSASTEQPRRSGTRPITRA